MKVFYLAYPLLWKSYKIMCLTILSKPGEEKMLFDKFTEGLTLATYYSGLRHKVIANNISNSETPGYKALDISFQEQLEDFMESGNTNSGKISPDPPKLILRPDMSSYKMRIDGNTVSLDQEMTKLSQNTILHNTYLQLLNSRFRILKAAISENV
ncbi:flagellar basal body rod protein FlgB [Candidatus Poribacteria bacterium]|nr:flagellar basal body rod protein FlgB [Candidatus Poribacteria bacterium]